MKTAEAAASNIRRTWKATTHLLELPEELLEYIADFLAHELPSALLELRSTCRRWAEATERILAQCYFSDRTFFICDEQSLGVLVSISEHAIFAKSMRRLAFALHEVPPLQPNKSFRKHLWRRHKRDPATRTSLVKARKTYRDIYDAQTAFQDHDGDLKCLKRALRNFVEAGVSIAITATGTAISDSRQLDPTVVQAWGYNKLRRALDDEPNLYMGSRRGLVMIMAAIWETGYPIMELEIGAETMGMPLQWFVNYHAIKHSDAFTNLHTLRLTLGLNLSDDDVERTKEKEVLLLVMDFSCFLAAATNLKTLYVAAEDTWCRTRFSQFVFFAVPLALMHGDNSLRHLESLELRLLEIELKRLVAFLENEHIPLKCLKMSLIMDDSPRSEQQPTDVEREIRRTTRGENLLLEIDRCYADHPLAGV